MDKIIEKALEGLEKEIGQDKLMVLATRNEEGADNRLCPVRAASTF